MSAIDSSSKNNIHLGILNDALELEKQVDVPVYCVASDIDGVDEAEDYHEKFVNDLLSKSYFLGGSQC